MNCWVVPATIDAVAGATVMETIVGLRTVSEVLPVIEPKAAAIEVVPTNAPPVARPEAEIVAMPVIEELQVTLPVRFCVLLSV